MISFVTKRLLYGGLVLSLVILIISSIIYLAPVDPARLTFGQRSDSETVKQKREALGLDQPLYIQLGRYLRDLAPISLHSKDELKDYKYISLFSTQNNVLVLKRPYLRESYQTGRSVADMLFEALPLTMILALTAICLACLIGIPLGVLAAVKQNSWLDFTAIIGSVVGISLPSYVSAMILALIFGFYLSDITGLNIQGSLIELNDFGEVQYVWKNLILPSIALGIRPIAIITQLTRSAMLDVLSQDYIRTAKAKGLSNFKIVVQHAFRNALNPILTAISGWFAALLAGAFFVENVFNYKGLGFMTVNALLNFDIPVVLGTVLLTAALFVILNIVVDILYAVLDPRIRLNA